MNKKLLVLIIALIAIALSVFVFLASNQSENTVQTTDITDPSNQSAPETPRNMPAGTYTDYSESAIADATGTVLLFFHAPWCPQCRALENDILSSGVPAGVTIIKVDYDDNQDLRQKYGVTLQTTLVKVDDSGNLIEKFIAYSEPTLAAVKANLL